MGRQHGQPQLIDRPLLHHRRKNGDKSLFNPAELRFLPYKQYRDSLLLRRGQYLRTERAVPLYVGQGNLPHIQPPQQLGDSVGVVGVVVGHHQQINRASAHGLEVVGRHIPGIIPAVPAAVH